VTEFTTSFFTIDLNFILSFGVNGIPLEGENKPDWIPHLGFPPLVKVGNPVKWWDDPTCKNLAKNQFIFIGFKNATDCIQYIDLLRDDIPVQDTIIDRYQIHNYISNIIKAKNQRENKCGSYTIWENI
jgi:hypothetical protein